MTVCDLNLGDEIVGRVARELPDLERGAATRGGRVVPVRHWQIESDSICKGWSGWLRSVSGQLYEVDDRDTFWILGFNELAKRVVLADSDFGRQPISDRMRPRYIRGLRALRLLLTEENDGQRESVDPDDLSEAKGFISRAMRKNQWDWFTVSRIMGHPDRRWCQPRQDLIGQTRRSLHEGDGSELDLLRKLRSQLSVAEVERWLGLVEQSTPLLSKSTIFKQSTEQAPLDEEGDGADEYIVSRTARLKIERANSEHARTLAVLETYLSQFGYIVEHSRLIDAFARLKSGPAIFEIKSINEQNERSQCRHALSQLYEYKYLHELPDASLWIVFSSKPVKPWLIDYLCTDRELKVLWLEGDALGGPAIGDLD